MILRLREAGMIEYIFRVVWNPVVVKSNFLKKLKKLKLSKLVRRIQNIFIDWYFTKLNREVSQSLFGTSAPPVTDYDEEVLAHEVNSDAFMAQLKELDPDIVLVNGAPILNERLLKAFPMKFVNVHFGITPNYRGVCTLFWPLYRGDFDKLGVTLYYIDQNIDGGPILGQGYPALDKADTEATIMAKCIILAINMFFSFLEAKDKGSVTGHTSLEKGLLFKSHDRWGGQDMLYCFKKAMGFVQIPNRRSRTVTYF